LSEVEVRNVVTDDAERIAAIYEHHVLNGTASYEIEPPSVDVTRAKVERITARGWPFLVARVDGAVVGYCYAEQLRDRPAYRYTCENSIYLDHRFIGRGIGKRLLSELCARAEACGFRQMIAVIGGAEPASIALHRSGGFEVVGRLHSVGWKNGRWLDTVYMQRALGAGDTGPGDI